MSATDMPVGFLERNQECRMELLKRGFQPGTTGFLTTYKGRFLKLVCVTFTPHPVTLGIFTQNMFALGKV